MDDLQNGFLVPIKDVLSLKSAIEKMITIPPEERIAMGKHSRQKAVKEFDEALNHKKYLGVIKEIFDNLKFYLIASFILVNILPTIFYINNLRYISFY